MKTEAQKRTARKHKQRLKNKVYGAIAFISLFMVLGIVGSIEQGADLYNMVYAFAFICLFAFASYKGGYMA